MEKGGNRQGTIGNCQGKPGTYLGSFWEQSGDNQGHIRDFWGTDWEFTGIYLGNGRTFSGNVPVRDISGVLGDTLTSAFVIQMRILHFSPQVFYLFGPRWFPKKIPDKSQGTFSKSSRYDKNVELYPEGGVTMANRTRIKQVRLTEDEAAVISEAAKKEEISESKYIRAQLFKSEQRHFPKEVLDQLADLNYQIRKIGININQVVRTCNEQKNITRFDFAQLLEYEKMLAAKFEKTYQILRNLEHNLR
jgi:hypothetical protein